MDGWKFIIEVTYDPDEMQLAFLHEVFHTYDADHVTPGNYIMYYSIKGGGWNLHSTTKNTVSTHGTHFRWKKEE
jgi:glutamine cyclotransferase